MNTMDGQLSQWRDRALAMERAVGSAMVGLAGPIRLVTTAVFARGHVMLQGDVGVGKTTLLRAFAHVMGGRFGRIEGTVDLMPNDLLYHTYITQDGRPAVEPGPLTSEGEDLAIFFFNEINRARPQVHALMLRVMAERSVHAFNRAVRLPYLQVFADRNRVEREETFEIASAARDRFMMEISIDAPQDDATRRQLVFDTRFHDTDRLIGGLPAGLVPPQELPGVAEQIQSAVLATPDLQDYVLRLWQATAAPERFDVHLSGLPPGMAEGIDIADLVLAGASPRGMSMLLRAARVMAWLDGRSQVLPEDIRAVFCEVVGHRICLQPVYELRRQDIVVPLMRGILDRVRAP